MTRNDIVQLRGEIAALRLLLVPCLGFLAKHYDDPTGHLREVKRFALAAVRQLSPGLAAPRDQETFSQAAISLIEWAISEADESETSSSPRLQ